MRLFIAVPASAGLLKRAEAARGFLAENEPRFKPASPCQLHCTLRFLGETSPALVPELQNAITRCAAANTPFELTGTGIGFFRTPKQPAVAWLGAAESRDLNRLKATLDAELALCGLPPDPRPFAPHFTLGRAPAAVADKLAETAARFTCAQSGGMTAACIALYESQTEPGGARHTQIFRAALKGAA